MTAAYYNEHDAFAAAWLRELIKAGLIAPGDVDERSIEDVLPNELAGYTQCHFFAGIGVWSYALRRAGWPDDRPVWTGSCPCQPFSTAGKGDGFADERHLWPAFYHLIGQRRPDIVFGEQVASKDADTWIDLVHTDMEALGYAFGAVPFPAAGVGAQNIRDRLYWVADAEHQQHERRVSGLGFNRETQRGGETAELAGHREVGGVANTSCERRHARGDGNHGGDDRTIPHAAQPDGWLVHPIIDGLEGQPRNGDDRDEPGRIGAKPSGPVTQANAIVRPGPTNGFWRTADWLGCRDGKWRPVEARIQQMVDGTALRVGSLCSDLQTKIKEVINEAEKRLQAETGTILRALRETINSENIFWAGGGILGVHEAQILLAYLLEYARQEGNESNAAHGSGTLGTHQRDVRMLWRNREAFNTPYQRELERRTYRELADTLRLLSSAVARFAQEAGYKMLYTDAPASFPLGIWLKNNTQDTLGKFPPSNRAARLRGYGNAINAEAAKAFIESYLEIG